MARHSLRLCSALLAAASASVAAGVATFLAPHLDPLAAAGVAFAGAAVAGAAVWAGLAPLARLAAAADEVAGGGRRPADLPEASGELAALVGAVRAVEARRAEREMAHQTDLKVLTVSLKVLADQKATPVLPTLSSSDATAAADLLAAFDAAVKDGTATRQRLAWAGRVLAAIPDAVVATDGTGAPRYLNPVAEKLFGATAVTANKAPVTALFADAGEPVAAGDDPALPVAGSAEVADWVRAGAAGPLVARTKAGQLVELTGVVQGKTVKDRVVCLTARDAAVGHDRTAADRAAVREAATRRFLTRYLHESTDALAQIGAQLRLLTGEAKQSGHRDAMLTKLAAANQGLRRLDTFHTLADWFRATVWGDLPAATPSEFTPAEVATLVGEKLAARLKGRGNVLKVTDQGGWMFADADRLEAALTGLLAHAGDAAANTQLELRITRKPASADLPPATEFYLPDAGPALSAEHLAVVDKPFGGLAPAPLDKFDGADGFPLGLAVAARLAPALDGELHLENGPAGQLAVRLLVPSRRAADAPPATVAVAAPGALDVAPAEETVAGWRLGVPTPQVVA
jgi:signal transduction histidine kinase